MIIDYPTVIRALVLIVCRDNDGAGLELYGVGIDASSEEEDELNILSDVSLDESDYPLHNEVLLSALYFDQPTTTSGVTAEQGTNLVSLQAREGDLLNCLLCNS